MKKILITGANSYIGTSFEKWIKQYDGYEINTVDTKNNKWKETDFSKYDVVFHVAGIAHADPKPEMKDMYYEVNTELAVEVAEYAKKNDVGQFIFMSSIILYGSDNTYIDKNTEPKPKNFYGDSKLQADIRLHKLQSEEFNVVSMRPPMIYGRNSRGNYTRLASIAKRIPCFPGVDNKRSMLYIENLCECIRLVIDNNEKGFFYPQNREYVNTSELVRIIAKQYGKNIKIITLFDPMLKWLSGKITVFNKLFGDLCYAKELSAHFGWEYCIVDFEESIKRTEV